MSNREKLESALNVLNALAGRAEQDKDGGYQVGGMRYGDLVDAASGLRAVLRDESDRKRRGEPVAWRTYDRNGWYVFSPTHEEAERGFPGKDHQPLYAAPQPVEPVKVPSDAQPLLDMIDILCTGLEWNIENHPEVMNEADGEALTEARALLDRYGQCLEQSVAWRWSESNGEHWFGWTTDWSYHDRAVEMGCQIEYAAPIVLKQVG